eukprot:m.88071 g.88071  ORF g.88071 m.88071 type:complete len:625 (+) comp36558_c0_seq6:495-2369(+)
MEHLVRKLNVRTHGWPHHHRDGWGYVTREVLEKHLHIEGGIECITAVEDEIFLLSNSSSSLQGTPFSRPWVGFIHQVPVTLYKDFPDLSRLVGSPLFIDSLTTCLGLFVLSKESKTYLRGHLDVPVCSCLYPAVPSASQNRFSLAKFQKNQPKRVVMIGHYLRRFHDLCDLSVPVGFQKYLLKPFSRDNSKWNDLQLQLNSTVKFLERQPEENYEKLLSQCVVFLSLADAAACTTVVECMCRATPLLVNRLPALEEYLGFDYPLFYETLDEASQLITFDKIKQAHQYLVDLSTKSRIEPASFLRAITNSAIFRSLPNPQGNDMTFLRRCDVTVLICSYKRTDTMKQILDGFCCQDFHGSFEVIVWNNNASTQAELSSLFQSYHDEGRLNVKLCQSNENYFCIVRQAIAHLMTGAVLVTCDDDVFPEPSYLTMFYARHKAYGESAALCCRGHVFRDHMLDVADPGRFWSHHEGQRIFYDETKKDIQVHFLHGGSCLIPSHMLHEVLEYAMPQPEFALVDDYWLSFVISHYLRHPIWKIRANSMFTMTESAADPDIALAFNAEVREQRTNFYVYHMKQGWPKSCLNKKMEKPRIVTSVAKRDATAIYAPDVSTTGTYQPLPDQYSV